MALRRLGRDRPVEVAARSDRRCVRPGNADRARGQPERGRLAVIDALGGQAAGALAAAIARGPPADAVATEN